MSGKKREEKAEILTKFFGKEMTLLEWFIILILITIFLIVIFVYLFQ